MIARYSPFNDLFRDDFWNFALGGLANTNANAQNAFTPAVDVVATEQGYELKVEVPGVKPEDISVSLENNVLTLKGERKFEEAKEDRGYRRIERRYGSFTRSFVLPEGVNAEAIEASAKDGVLTVSVPKVPATTPRKIPVNASGLLDKAKQLINKNKPEEQPTAQAH
jgi:HSP20 family protein